MKSTSRALHRSFLVSPLMSVDRETACWRLRTTRATDAMRHSALGLGRVKTPTFNLRVEIPSRFRKFENQKCLRPLLREDDRENRSIATKTLRPRYVCSSADSDRRAHMARGPKSANSGNQNVGRGRLSSMPLQSFPSIRLRYRASEVFALRRNPLVPRDCRSR